MDSSKYRVAQLGDTSVYQVQYWGPNRSQWSLWRWLTRQPQLPHLPEGWHTHYKELCGYDCHSVKSEWQGKGAYEQACELRDRLIEEDRIAMERTRLFMVGLWPTARPC